MNNDFFDNLISKLDNLDSNNMQAFVLRLVKKKGFLETIFNAIREGIVVIDRYLFIQYANRGAVELLGLPDNLDEQKISTFLRDIDWQRILQEDEHEWYRISRQEIKIYYPETKILNFYIVPHEDEENDEQLATIILNDITETRRNQLEYFESEKMKLMSMLAAGVAHEIGNPLNSISIHLQLLDRYFRDNSEEDNSEGLELVDICKNEVNRLDMIITQFLSALRPTNPEMEDINIKDLVYETLDFMNNELSGRSIKIDTSWPETVPNIKGDPTQIKQAIFNLIKNASQAIREEGKIEVACSKTEEHLFLSISDTGCGINSKDMNNIFEPYYSNREKGTGLGLMIVERITREHGAELNVESETEKGTTFTIKFPLNINKNRLLNPPGSSQKNNS